MRGAMLIEDQGHGADLGADAVRRRMVTADVVGRTKRDRVTGAVLVFDGEIAGQDVDDMALAAPVIREVAGAVFDSPQADAAELARTHRGDAPGTRLDRWSNVPPVGDSRRNVREMQIVFLRQVHANAIEQGCGARGPAIRGPKPAKMEGGGEARRAWS